MTDQAVGLRKWREDQSSVEDRKDQVRTITITSGKGGVGKSNVTVNLALALAKLNKKALVLDADLGTANVDILLGMDPPHKLHDVLYGKKLLTDIILEGPLGIHFIPGSSGLMDIASISEKEQQKFMNEFAQLKDRTDYLLIDTGAGLSKSVLGFMMASDEVILITTPEPTSIADAYSIAKTISRYQLHASVHLIVNQAKGQGEGTQVAERFMKVAGKFLSLQINHIGTIVQDPLVARSVREQRPFLINYPQAKASKGVLETARRLNASGSSQKKAGFQGFLDTLARFFS